MAKQNIIAEIVSNFLSKLNANFTELYGNDETMAGNISTISSGLGNKADYSFKNIKIGEITIEADSKEDTIELVAGANITLQPDVVNDKVTIVYTPPTTICKAFTISNFTNSSADFTYTIPLGSTLNRCRFSLDITNITHANSTNDTFTGAIVANGIMDVTTGNLIETYIGVAKPTSGSSIPFLCGALGTYVTITGGTRIYLSPVISSGFASITMVIRGSTTNQTLSACSGSLFVYPY